MLKKPESSEFTDDESDEFSVSESEGAVRIAISFIIALSTGNMVKIAVIT